MRLLITILLLFTIGFTEAQTYTFSKSNCLLEVYRGASLEYNLQLSNTTWADISSNLIEIKDGVTSVSVYNYQIGNYTGTTIDSLKLDLTAWTDTCASATSADIYWEADATSGVTPKDNERISLDSGSVARTEIWAGDSLTNIQTTGLIFQTANDLDSYQIRLNMGVENTNGEGWGNGLQAIDFSTFTVVTNAITNDEGSGLYQPEMSVLQMAKDVGYLVEVDSLGFKLRALDGLAVHSKQVQISGDEDELIFSATDFTGATAINITKDSATTTHLDGAGDTTKLIIKTDVIRLDSDTAKIDGVLVMPNRVVSYTPSSESDPAYPIGTVAYDATYIYRKVGATLWRRTAFGAGGW